MKAIYVICLVRMEGELQSQRDMLNNIDKTIRDLQKNAALGSANGC